mmetsp:Transcript_53971/g.118196  ORF Transcript_53971/g.118196 Transcript_53971/m.118196 type:complete len:131 (-) Transcript_53971:118-510(-)
MHTKVTETTSTTRSCKHISGTASSVTLKKRQYFSSVDSMDCKRATSASEFCTAPRDPSQRKPALQATERQDARKKNPQAGRKALKNIHHIRCLKLVSLAVHNSSDWPSVMCDISVQNIDTKAATRKCRTY